MRAGVTSRELVEGHWRPSTEGDAGAAWEPSLARGIVERTAAAGTGATLDWAAIARELAMPAAPRAPLEVVFFGDAKVHDGRFAENAWLQELGDPVTKLTWDNAALVSPSTAARSGIASEDVVELEVRGRTVRAPVLVVPGMADDVVAVALGYGQTSRDGASSVSSGVGANAYAVRDSRAPWFDDASIRKTGASWPLALTQEHWSMEGRPIVLCADARRVPRATRPSRRRTTSRRRSLYGTRARTRPTSGA